MEPTAIVIMFDGRKAADNELATIVKLLSGSGVIQSNVPLVLQFSSEEIAKHLIPEHVNEDVTAADNAAYYINGCFERMLVEKDYMTLAVALTCNAIKDDRLRTAIEILSQPNIAISRKASRDCHLNKDAISIIKHVHEQLN